MVRIKENLEDSVEEGQEVKVELLEGDKVYIFLQEGIFVYLCVCVWDEVRRVLGEVMYGFLLILQILIFNYQSVVMIICFMFLWFLVYYFYRVIVCLLVCVQQIIGVMQ